MLYPDVHKIKNLLPFYNRITFYKEVAGDIFTPVSILKNFSNEDNFFLFESANIDKTFSRFSFFSKHPENITLFRGNNGNPVEFLREKLKHDKVFADKKFGDFSGGFVGFIGYEAVNYMNVLRKRIKESVNDTVSAFMEIKKFYIFDNFTNKLYAAYSSETNGKHTDIYQRAENILNSMTEELFKKNEDTALSDIDANVFLKKEYSEEEFIKKVKKLKKEIINGETIQTVFSQKFEIDCKINPVSFYRAIRNINPSPYLFYLKFKNFVLLGSSPETHLKISNRKAILKPIAGTYPIKKNIETVKNNLLKDQKELSEHLMLLDLARNDLYQGCKTESVNVVSSFKTEIYSHVIHIVSEVEGILDDTVSSFELFTKTFPAGTVTGAPKVRAMELINDYEKSTRGFYAGCVGYFGYNGNLDTCITIRSALITPEKIILRAGAGIVADSNPETELREVEKKLAALFYAIKILKNIEEKNVFTN